MKAIRTRYLGPTNTRGSRIIASDGEGHSISLGYPHAPCSTAAHELAAYLLMQKMGWPNALSGGMFRYDYYWTMLPRDDRKAPPAYVGFLASDKTQSERVA